MRYKIIIELTGVAFEIVPCFEGILSYAWKQLHADKDYKEFPIDKNGGYYLASQMIIDPTLITNRGAFRFDNRVVHYVDVPEVEFTFQTDDVEEIERMMNELKFIGAMRNKGYGEIISYRIENYDGQILRPIPCRFVSEGMKNYDISYRAWRMPYTDTKNRELCSLVEL